MGKINKGNSNWTANLSMTNKNIEITATNIIIVTWFQDPQKAMYRPIGRSICHKVSKRKYEGCRIHEQDTRNDVHILCRYTQTSRYPYKSNYFKNVIGRWLIEVLISCMARLGWWVTAIMALEVSGYIYLCIAWPETPPRCPGWTIVQLGSSERTIPYCTIESTINLSLQLSLYPLPTTGTNWQCHFHIPVWDPTKPWPFGSN